MIKSMTKKTNNKKGFTLIELIVVIAILGILAAIAIPRFSGLRHEATVKAEASTAGSILSAARIQEAETGNEVDSGLLTVVNPADDTTAAEEVGAGEIHKKYMIIPTGDPGYVITKSGDLYTVTWDTEAGGTYADESFTLIEGEAFTATPN